MMDFESQMRAALARKEPGADFAARVLARVEAREQAGRRPGMGGRRRRLRLRCWSVAGARWIWVSGGNASAARRRVRN